MDTASMLAHDGRRLGASIGKMPMGHIPTPWRSCIPQSSAHQLPSRLTGRQARGTRPWKGAFELLVVLTLGITCCGTCLPQQRAGWRAGTVGPPEGEHLLAPSDLSCLMAARTPSPVALLKVEMRM